MPRGKKSDGLTVPNRAPAMSPEGQENRMIALAIDLAEKQLIEGTASSQVITHYLKLGTVKEKLELEKLKKENELLIAKTEAINSAKRSEQLYSEAISAFKRYQGINDGEEYDDYYDSDL
jgi:hypothetical protein